METNDQSMERLRFSLTNHALRGETDLARIEAVRETAIAFAEDVIDHCESSRERSLALTAIEEATMWAVKSIIMEQHNDS